MFNAIRPFLSRIIAGWVAAFVAYLSNRFGLTLDADTQQGLLAVALGIFGTVYPLVHRLIDKKLNPGDAASGSLAAAEKEQVAVMDSNIPNYRG